MKNCRNSQNNDDPYMKAYSKLKMTTKMKTIKRSPKKETGKEIKTTPMIRQPRNEDGGN